MSQRTKPVKIPRKCINKMGVLNVQRCKNTNTKDNISFAIYYLKKIVTSIYK